VVITTTCFVVVVINLGTCNNDAIIVLDCRDHYQTRPHTREAAQPPTQEERTAEGRKYCLPGCRALHNYQFKLWSWGTCQSCVAMATRLWWHSCVCVCPSNVDRIIH